MWKISLVASGKQEVALLASLKDPTSGQRELSIQLADAAGTIGSSNILNIKIYYAARIILFLNRSAYNFCP